MDLLGERRAPGLQVQGRESEEALKTATKYAGPYDKFKSDPLESINAMTPADWRQAGVLAVDDRVLWTVGEEQFNVYFREEEKTA